MFFFLWLFSYDIFILWLFDLYSAAYIESLTQAWCYVYIQFQIVYSWSHIRIKYLCSGWVSMETIHLTLLRTYLTYISSILNIYQNNSKNLSSWWLSSFYWEDIWKVFNKTFYIRQNAISNLNRKANSTFALKKMSQWKKIRKIVFHDSSLPKSQSLPKSFDLFISDHGIYIWSLNLDVQLIQLRKNTGER